MDPKAMADAFMAFQRQAKERVAAVRATLPPFSPELSAEIAAQAAAHPMPQGHEHGEAASPEEVEAAQRVAQQSLAAEYPRDGFAADDPRIAPIEGIPLEVFAIAAKSICWSPDEAFQERVVRALGVDPDAWRRASEEWKRRFSSDVVVAAYYGQIYSEA